MNMSKKTLNVSIIQMPVQSTKENLLYLKQSVDALMCGYVRPELILGVEFGITAEPEPIPGPCTQFLSELAKKYHIYFVPGTMAERAPELPDGQYYNTCPVFAPDGTLIHAYRKRVPFWPEEPSAPGEDLGCCTFRIAEKDITAGLLICYEQFFPEIPRTLALEGAELLLCPSLDTVEFSSVPDILPRARALENEVYYIWTCSAGPGVHGTYCGKSTVVDPEGRVIHQCGPAPELITLTLDIGRVREKRVLGADQHLASLKRFRVASPYAGRIGEAPVYRDLEPLTETPAEYAERLKQYNRPVLSTDGSGVESAQADQRMTEILEAYERENA